MGYPNSSGQVLGCLGLVAVAALGVAAGMGVVMVVVMVVVAVEVALLVAWLLREFEEVQRVKKKKKKNHQISGVSYDVDMIFLV